PGFGPGGRVVDGELVLDRARVEARKTFGDLQGFGIRVLEGGAGPEIGGFDDQRAALPVATGVPMPPMDACGKMRAPIQGDDASLAVPLVFDQHVPGRLHDVNVAVVGSRKYGRSAKGE